MRRAAAAYTDGAVTSPACKASLQPSMDRLQASSSGTGWTTEWTQHCPAGLGTRDPGTVGLLRGGQATPRPEIARVLCVDWDAKTGRAKPRPSTRPLGLGALAACRSVGRSNYCTLSCRRSCALYVGSTSRTLLRAHDGRMRLSMRACAEWNGGWNAARTWSSRLRLEMSSP